MELGFSKIEGEHSIEDDAAAVNPDFDRGTDHQLNCGNCAVAYEMRRRGLDVAALPGSKGMTLAEITGMFDSIVMRSPRGGAKDAAQQEIVREALSWGDGARGIIGGSWDHCGGHIFSFETKDGHVKFLDPQRPSRNAGGFLKNMIPSSIFFCRTDNLKLNSGVRSAVINRGK